MKAREGTIAALLLAALALLGAEPARAQEEAAGAFEPWAVVVLVAGRVEVERPPRAPGEKAAVRAALVEGAVLGVGDRVIPAKDARAVVVRRDGRSATIVRPREVGVDADTAAAASPSFVALLELARLLARAPEGEPSGTRGDELEPFPRSRVLTDRPTFVWSAEDGALFRLRVARVDAEAGKVETAIDERVAGARWELPAEREALAAGLYELSVEEVGGARRVAEPVRFLVLASEDRERIGARREEWAKRVAGLDPWLRHLLMAVFYRQEGVFLLEESRRELGRVLALRPDHQLAGALLADVKRLLRLR